MMLPPLRRQCILEDIAHLGVGLVPELSEKYGVSEMTIRRDLDALERAGLVAGDREAGNRRVQHVTVTESGEALFLRLRRAAASFDGRLRAGLDDADVADLRRLLGHLTENARPD